MKKIIIFFILLLVISCSKQKDNQIINQKNEEIMGRRPKPPVQNNIPAPTGLTAVATSSTSVTLTWNPVPNATTYWIYRDNYVPAIIPGTTYNDLTLNPNTTYSYAVAAVVNSTLGTKSAPVSVTTLQ